MASSLYAFIVAHRPQIIDRARARVKARLPPKSAEAKLDNGIPLFLTQLVEAIGPRGEPALHLVRPDDARHITDTASINGHALLRSGFTVAQVVHGYGDICQVVTELAGENADAITTADFQRFNSCLDDAIAGAVTAFGQQRESDLAYEGSERLGVFAHELRNLLTSAVMSFEVIKRGTVPLGGSVSAMHSRSLASMTALVERSLAEVRLGAGMPKFERISLVEFIDEIQVAASMEAEGANIRLSIDTMDGDVLVDVDRQLLSSAVTNLLQNAFKFTPANGKVVLTARATSERALIEVEDECGGLPPGKAQEIFKPFVQAGSDQSGLGLGLAIAVSAVRANHGELSVRDIAGRGCVFTIDLPRDIRAPTSLFRERHDVESESPDGSEQPARQR